MAAYLTTRYRLGDDGELCEVVVLEDADEAPKVDEAPPATRAPTPAAWTQDRDSLWWSRQLGPRPGSD